MLDIKLIRTQPELVRENIKKKFQLDKLPLVDEVLSLDAEYRAAHTRCDYLRSQRNAISKSIGSLVASGPSEGLGTGEKTEKKVRGIVQESAPQDLDSAELDPAAVAAKIKQYRGALVACYEAALRRNASLSGKITLRFTISKLGKVSSVDIEVDTMHDDDFNKCIIDRASSWRFPPPQGGTSDVQFAYPFIFQSAK